MSKLLAVASIIGILTIICMTNLNAYAFEMIGYSETSVTVQEEAVYCGGDRIHPEIVVKDQDGDIITQTAVGSQVLVEATVKLNCNTARHPSMMVFEVRDAEGMTAYLALQTIPKHLDNQMTAGLSWIPDRPGDYDVRFLLAFCLQCTGGLNPVVTYEITVV